MGLVCSNQAPWLCDCSQCAEAFRDPAHSILAAKTSEKKDNLAGFREGNDPEETVS